jgi:hypothetical protein
MPDESDGDCNLACQTKIILNGGNIAGIATTTHAALDNFFKKGGSFKGGKKLIGLLNDIEDKIVEAQALAAKGMGYDGPVGKMLE